LFTGGSYSLRTSTGSSSVYYRLVGDLADRLRETVSDENSLREEVRRASTWRGLFEKLLPGRVSARRILRELDGVLGPFLSDLKEHLHSITLAERMDRTLRTERDQYLLFMLEIELTNRINNRGFEKAPWRMALLAHCLKDFKDTCVSRPAEVEEKCMGCSAECCINLGTQLLARYGIHTYISVSMDLRRVLGKLKVDHPQMGAVGIACIPELVMGMRLCEKMDIPVVGVPLDANRCARWVGKCLETTFNLEELERLIKAV